MVMAMEGVMVVRLVLVVLVVRLVLLSTIHSVDE